MMPAVLLLDDKVAVEEELVETAAVSCEVAVG